MRLPVQEHILCFFNLEYKRASLPRITKVYNLFKASGLERYPVLRRQIVKLYTLFKTQDPENHTCLAAHIERS